MVYREAAILSQATRIKNDIENHFVPITQISEAVVRGGQLKYAAWSQLRDYALEFKKILNGKFRRHSEFLRRNFIHFDGISDDCDIIEAKIKVLNMFHDILLENLRSKECYYSISENAPDGKEILELCSETVDTLSETKELIDDMWKSVLQKTENDGLKLDITHIK